MEALLKSNLVPFA